MMVGWMAKRSKLRWYSLSNHYLLLDVGHHCPVEIDHPSGGLLLAIEDDQFHIIEGHHHSLDLDHQSTRNGLAVVHDPGQDQQ